MDVRADPFSKAEDEMRAMAAAPWWRTAPPRQRADAAASRMLTSGAQWWLYGAWGRWYRCGLDGHWHPCPPPATPAARATAVPVTPGAGNPPVPPGMLPTGPDLSAGRVAGAGLAGPQPSPDTVARVQQALIAALSVDPAQFPLRDPSFQPGTPSTVAAAWGALLWCAGAPVVPAEHPLIEVFAGYLTVGRDRLTWMVTPDLAQLCAYYTERLMARDALGAAHLARVMGEVAAALQGDPAFAPGAAALTAITQVSARYVHADMAAVGYGPAAVTQEWQRRCPPEHAIPIVREATPGEYLRLAVYDLTETVTALTAAPPPGAAPRPAGDPRRAAVALLAADLQAAPRAVPAVLPWLDPDAARTLQEVLAQPAHPLRQLWPQGGRLPDALRGTDAAVLRDLLATTYMIGLTWCRLARQAPPAPGFLVPAAAVQELASPAVTPPKGTGELTPWQIIDAARAHLAASLAAEAPAPAPPPEDALGDGFLAAFADPLAEPLAEAAQDPAGAAPSPWRFAPEPGPAAPEPAPVPAHDGGHAEETSIDPRAAAVHDAELTSADATSLDPDRQGRPRREIRVHLAELSALTGLDPVKEAVERLAAEAQVAAARKAAGLPESRGTGTTRHLGFAAAPGTGSSTVAAVLARVYAAAGLLQAATVTECTPADLAGPGGPVAGVRARADAAHGGILLIDRAADLGEPGARAVLGELTRAMDERPGLLVVCVDRPGPMAGLVAAVPALGRRLAEVITFPDPSDTDLAALFTAQAAARAYVPDDGLTAALPARIAALRHRPGFANALTVIRLLDDTVARQSLRIVRDGATMTSEALTRLTAADLP